MNSIEEIKRFFKTKKVDDSWAFDEYKPSERGKWSHSYHRYPAKFIPQLVEKLMDEYLNGRNEAHINDPFYGCGTTIVSAIARGYQASGTDINPVAHLITKVKGTSIKPAYLSKKITKFLGKIKVVTSNQTTLFGKDDVQPLIPERNMERIDYWFKEDNKIKLGKILRLINNEEDQKIRDFFLVAFSHCLKNCSIWLQASTKPTRDKDKEPSEPYDMLKRHLNKMRRGNKAFYKKVPEKVRKNLKQYLNVVIGDARKQPVEDNTVDLVITSSPYVTSYEYADLHQLSTIWFDYADDYRELREDFIGTAYKEYEKKKLTGELAKRTVQQLAEKDERTSKNAEAFFIDMEEVFKESKRILKKGGRCCYVIGNTQLKKVRIFNAEIFAEGLQNAGLEFDRLIKREIHSKLLPQKRDKETGRFASNEDADTEAYPVEYIVIGLKR
jgi:hypothetical protein